MSASRERRANVAETFSERRANVLYRGRGRGRERGTAFVRKHIAVCVCACPLAVDRGAA